ncbi:MAG TPA: fatty acid cis/trans isomerase, partial [Polyangiaceae bacterium]
DNLRLVPRYGHYLKLQNRYLEGRRKAAHLAFPLPLDRALGLLWNGGGTNPNAALTVYRHSDSASVDQGFVGDPPKTAWFLDYPLLERIHYLLVAGFDVYGNLGHQLNTRLHMDVLRMEAEDNLLAYLPAKVRKSVHDSWYKGIRSGDGDDIVPWWMDVDLVTGYQTTTPQQELYEHVATRLGSLSKPNIPRPCSGPDCDSQAHEAALLRANQAIFKLSRMHGKIVEFLPDVAFLRVELGGAPEADLAYTLLSDKSYDNVSSMFSEHELGERRDASGDGQTVLPWLEGSYPEFFFSVPLADVENFAVRYDAIQNRNEYERFTARFGVRRTNPGFWRAADWFNAQALREQPERAGILDLNRYQDR